MAVTSTAGFTGVGDQAVDLVVVAAAQFRADAGVMLQRLDKFRVGLWMEGERLH